MQVGRFSRMFAAVAAAGLIAAACGGGGTNKANPSSAPTKGGKIVLGAEQYPECINVVTQCASASWLYWSGTQYVYPRTMQLTLDFGFEKSPLITEAPSLANGGLTQSPFSVTFHINPAAKWADGTPITAADFEFTRNAIMNTTGTISTTGYDQLEPIDTSTPATVKLNFKDIFVDWPDIFGGATGVVMEKAAFPKEASAAKVDLSKEMQDNIPFSGGPWKMQSWSKDQTVLVRNDNYWGHKPLLDQVTIVPRTDPTTETNDLLSGAIQAIFPQPGITSFLKQFGSNPNVKFKSGPGVFYEGLWMNLSKFPFNDPAVRQAFMWGVDRQSVLTNLINLNDPTQKTPLGCGTLSFPNTPLCSVTPFAQFHYDPAMVATILQGAGWAKDSKGFWAKNGQQLAFIYETTTKDRRVTTQAILKEKMVAAGFNVTTKVDDATLLFETKLPHGDFQVADFAEGGSPDPSITSFLSCKNIPTAANSFAGQNAFHWCNQQATTLMEESDKELDPAKRNAMLQQVYMLQAQDFAPMVPLYILPQLTAWRSDKIAGPVGLWNNTFYGGFWNMDEWYCAHAGSCT